MKINVLATESVLVIDKDSSDWEMNGRKGTSYKAYCHTKKDGKVSVDEIKVTEEVYNKLEEMTKYYFGGELDIKNGRFVANSAELSPAKSTSAAHATANK